MTATSGNDTVDNYGTMIGSINLGAGVNAFNNRAGGLFDMGANVMLGTGNFLTNNGTMSARRYRQRLHKRGDRQSRPVEPARRICST